LDTITTALMQGDWVELRDFGVFAVKMRQARTLTTHQIFWRASPAV